MRPRITLTNTRTYLALILGSLLAAPAFAGMDPEHVFAEAKGYTVKIRTSVAIPFDEDTKGTVMGAGFVVDLKRHWIATNAHVVSRSKAMLRVSSTATDFQPAVPVYVDPLFDIAIIQVADVSGLSEASLQCDERPTTGLAVGAFGHPWNYSYTGTKGIISGYTSNLKKFGDFLQTDAPINPGNSGGPLINLKTGQVVGINTAGLTDAQNMNYAIPMKAVCSVLNLLKQGRDPTPPDFPFSFYKDNDDKNTLRIAQIVPSGRYLDAQMGDAIIAAGIAHTPVDNEPQMLNVLRGQLDHVELVARRGNTTVVLKGTIRPVPNVFARKGLAFSGLMLRREYNQDFIHFNGKDHMLNIEYVEGGGLAESRGIAARQELVSVNGTLTSEIDQVYQIVSALKPGDDVTLGLKYFSGEQEHLYGYRERKVPLENLR